MNFFPTIGDFGFTVKKHLAVIGPVIPIEFAVEVPVETERIGSQNRIVADINVSIKGLRICRLAGSKEWINCREPPKAILVHAGFGEVELGFRVFLVAGKLLADVILV